MINVPRLIQTSRLFAIVLVAAAFASCAAHAQVRTPPLQVPTDPSASDSNPPGLANMPPDPNHVRMSKSMAEERNAIRQKQIVTDTQQLLDLAKQLKDAVDKSSKDQLSLSVVNTATEIEKLAKTVKEKMRDGQ
jgi:hypothetical protein